MRTGGPENGREGHSEPRNDEAGKSASKPPATISTMRKAWKQANDAKELQAQLSARNIRLACVSADEARACEQQRAVANQRGRRSGPLLTGGEIVAVDQRGRVYRFDKRTTGAAANAVRERLAGVDAATLDTVTAAKDAIKASRAAWIEKQQAKPDAGRAPTWIKKRSEWQTRLARVAQWKRYVSTSWGRRIFWFFLIFRVRPSEFVGRQFHPLYGKVSGIPFVPLGEPAVFFATAQAMDVSTYNKLLADKIWSGKSAAEIITRNQDQITMSHWAVLIFIPLVICTISVLRYLWYLGMRKFTDKVRKDGKTAGPAPVQFFIFHTSSIFCWLGILVLTVSITNSFFPGRPFATIYNFLMGNVLWYGTIVVTSVLIGVKYYQSNTHILMEIYKDERLISKVRRVSCVIAGVLFVAAPIAILFGVFGVLNKLSMMNAQ